MRHEPSERVTQELGIEICKRQGLKAAVVLATTSSLEGLQAYRTGQTLFRSGKQREAIPFLDPQFCSAYGALGTAYYSVSDDQASRKNFTKAYELKDARLTQEENFQTTALYHSYITGNLERKPLYLFCTSRYIHLEARGSGNPDTPSSQSRIQEAHRNRICHRFSVREKAIARFSKVRAPEGIAGSLMRDSARAEDPSREPDNSMVMKSKDSLGIRDVSAR